jgi:membrane-associated PAP2 superfamily phosphatase
MVISFVLIVLAVVFTWLSRDERSTDGSPAFGMTRQQALPLQKDHLLDLLNHRLAKYIAIALGAVALFYGAHTSVTRGWLRRRC